RPESGPRGRRRTVPVGRARAMAGRRRWAAEAGRRGRRDVRPGSPLDAEAAAPDGGAAMNAPPPALQLRRVSKRYGAGPTEVPALCEVDLVVAAGTMVAVMGPSGSGKSTLLTIAGSLEDPTSGEVLVGGATLSGMSRNQRARLRRRGIGYVFQDYNLLAG